MVGVVGVVGAITVFIDDPCGVLVATPLCLGGVWSVLRRPIERLVGRLWGGFVASWGAFGELCGGSGAALGGLWAAC